MNAPAAIKLDPVAAFMPWATLDERTLRRRMLAFQQRAGTRARQCEDDRARGLWWLICDLAAENAFAPQPKGQLEDLLATLTRLALCAGALERLESPRG